MRCLVAADATYNFQPALSLLRRLEFDRPEWHFAHVVSPIDPSPGSELMTGRDAANALREYFDDAGVVQRLTDELDGRVHLLQGGPASSLLRLAGSMQADVVGLGSSGRGPIGSALLGSVGRAFAIGSSRSFLVGRGKVADHGKIRAIFATDFSSYAREAFETFLRLGPHGIGEMVILTARHMLETAELLRYEELSDEAKAAKQDLNEHLERLGSEWVKECEKHSIRARAELLDGFVSSAIDAAVSEHKAHLVILGAQGHGFLERLVIGSVALHQVVTSKHSTMIVRAEVD